MADIINRPFVAEMAAARRFLSVLSDNNCWRDIREATSAIYDLRDMHLQTSGGAAWPKGKFFRTFHAVTERYDDLMDYIANRLFVDIDRGDLSDGQLTKLRPCLDELKATTLEFLDAAIALMPKIMFTRVADIAWLRQMANVFDNNDDQAAADSQPAGDDAEDRIAQNYEVIKEAIVTLPRLRRLISGMDAEGAQMKAGPVRMGALLNFPAALRTATPT